MKTRKILSLIMAVVMLVGCFSAFASATDKTNYVVLGDSIAYGSGLSNPTEACYGKMIADTCGFDYANYSVPGATTDALIRKLKEKAVIDAVEKADIISISIGGNDFLMNDIVSLMFDAVAKKDYSTFDEIGEGVYVNIGKIVGIIRDVNSDAVILLQTLYNPQLGYLREGYQYGADKVSEAILRYAQENPANIAVVDVASALGHDGANFADDCVHPSAKGNEIIAKEVLSSLNALGLTDKTELNSSAKGKDIAFGPFYSWALDFFGFFLTVLGKIFAPVFSIMK